MANRNIQMKKRNGEIWDNLYPLTAAANVFRTDGTSVEEALAALANVDDGSTPIDGGLFGETEDTAGEIDGGAF